MWAPMALPHHIQRATSPPTSPLPSAYIDQRTAPLRNHSYFYYCCSRAKRYPKLQSREGGKTSRVSSSAPFFRTSDMQMQPRGSSLRQNSGIAPSDVASSSKRRRNPPGNPKPDAEVVALSPQTLLATNRFLCEVCNKGFQRDQNLQLHLRGHKLPWKLKQRESKEPRRRVYVCPEPTCVHHNPTRALGDLTGIKKHYSRKHGEKSFKCNKCNKRYAVESDWKAHCKTCGNREYRCECTAVFSRKDSFMTHRANCRVALTMAANHCEIAGPIMPPPGASLYVDSGSDSLGPSGAAAHMHGFAEKGQSSSAAEASPIDHVVMPSFPAASSMLRSQTSGFSPSFFPMHVPGQQQQQHHPSSNNAYLGLFSGNSGGWSGVINDQFNGGAGCSNTTTEHGTVMASVGSHFGGGFPSLYSSPPPSAGLSATALLMKAAQMGSTSSTSLSGPSALLHAAGFTGTVVSGQGTSRAEAEERRSHEAHFNDLLMNSPPLMGGTGTGGFSGTAGLAGVDGGGNLSTRDFLGVGRDDTMAPPRFRMGAVDPSEMKWFM